MQVLTHSSALAAYLREITYQSAKDESHLQTEDLVGGFPHAIYHIRCSMHSVPKKAPISKVCFQCLV